MKTKGRAWVLSIGIAFVVMAGAVFACTGDNGGGDQASPPAIRPITPTPRPTATPSPTPTGTPTPTPVPEVCGFNPDPAPPNLLQVHEPAPKAQVKSPFHVRGWGARARFQDQGAEVALVNANGDVIDPDRFPVRAPPQTREGRIKPAGLDLTEFTGPFGVDVLLGVTQPTPVCIWVFERNEAGDPIHIAQVPVLVVP